MTLYIATPGQILATQSPRPAPAGGEIYLILASNGLYKIGRSKYAWQRKESLEIEMRQKLNLVRRFWVHDAPSAERMLHSFFHDKRVVGEWFALDRSEIETFLDLAGIMEKRTATIEGRYACVLTPND